MKNMKKFIPRKLKRWLVIGYVWLRCLIRGGKSKQPLLNLSEVLPTKGSGRIVHGGKVKLLHLRERFGDSWKNFNLTYFVSSGLPFAADLWVKIYKKFKIRIVWNQNGVAYPALYPAEVIKRVNSLMLPIHESDYVIYQAEFVKRCADRFLGEFKGPSSIIYNPVDSEHFIPRSTPLPLNPLVLLTTINHSSLERLDITLRSLKKLNEQEIQTKLIILGNIDKAGWSSAREDFKRLVDEQNLSEKVELRGAYLQEEAPKHFQDAHIFIHLKYLDPCPTLIIEAMSCGLPIVASRSGGLPEMVSEQSGVLIEAPEDFEHMHYPSIDEVITAIKTIYENLEPFSRAARKEASADKFNKKVWLKKHEEIFNKVLA
jgi:glycosyltransferase involved in cell wall biosynthesis